MAIPFAMLLTSQEEQTSMVFARSVLQNSNKTAINDS